MNDRARAIAVLQQARDILAERLTDQILESRDSILEDALGLAYTSEIDALQEQVGQRLNNINLLLNNLPPIEDAPPVNPEDMVPLAPPALGYDPERSDEADATSGEFGGPDLGRADSPSGDSGHVESDGTGAGSSLHLVAGNVPLPAAQDEAADDGETYFVQAATATVSFPALSSAPAAASPSGAASPSSAVERETSERAAPISFQAFAERIMANDVDGAGLVLAGLFDVTADRGRQCAARFQEQLSERPQFLQKAMGLRYELAAGSVNGSLILLWECFGLQGIESLSALQSLKSRLNPAGPSSA